MTTTTTICLRRINDIIEGAAVVVALRSTELINWETIGDETTTVDG